MSIYTCRYEEDIKYRYEAEMLSGIWSRKGEPLAPRTINARVDHACYFLVWMHDHDLRGSPNIPYKTVSLVRASSTNIFSTKPIKVVVRQGRLKTKTKAIRMPSDDALSIWLAAVYKRFGHTYGLICESILCTAMRAEEILSLDENCIDKDPSKWFIVNPTRPVEDQQIKIAISRGVKGAWGGNTDDRVKVGPERDILIPLSLAYAWHDYRRKERMKAFAHWMRNAPQGRRKEHASKAACLFLQDGSGAKITRSRLYYRWKTITPPVPGWSIHDGRNWWACAKLWRALSHAGLVNSLAEPYEGARNAYAKDVIRLEIIPQLGHVDEDTVDAYLKWLTAMVSTPVKLKPQFRSPHNVN